MDRLKKSKVIYRRSQAVIAGPSTFSKGPDQFAHGITPYALASGKGAYVWDVDGNKYLDYIMGLGCLILGYRHPHVERAVRKQISKGFSFSLAHFLEIEVAEMLCKRIPCAEMVRFGKNGNDVTSAAVRLARHVSGKEHILFCGYHGWQDWYVCQTSMNGGIPSVIKEYSHRFKYNDLVDLSRLLDKYKDSTACIIMEPVSRVYPEAGYLEAVRELADKYKVILIFDEIVAGFRFHKGGYQALCGVTPDLACFSKAMTNGLPLSALVGRKDIMSRCPEIYFSLTAAGETLSLAAARAVMEVFDRDNVAETIDKNGKRLMEGVEKLISLYELKDLVSIEGFPCRNVMLFRDFKGTPAVDIRTYWIQELAKRNILSNGSHMMSFAHKDKEISYTLGIYTEVLKLIKDGLSDGSLSAKLQCPPVKEPARAL
ncbi:MAG: aminotransferase class III-fold pyridoxal phosphate-dependent enzyme [Candidatus Omnitrophica bacterium]|nr:aminotransferase class III-fold pyridoxal phosphate-dependent enzyme [Candidatus Omnitrophota bacterium]